MTIKNLARRIIIRWWLLTHKDNSFFIDLYNELCKFNVSLVDSYVIMNSSKEHAKEIDEYLYERLEKKDQDTLLRFYLKRFFGVETINEKEREVIDSAFEGVKDYYSSDDVDCCKFPFRGHEVSYYCPMGLHTGSYNEKRLMDYYEVVHSFFLTEYEMEGFNPKDGGTILDCGAANGDTAILFSCLYPTSQIISFEFENAQFRNLLKNLRENHIENVIPVQSFLYADEGNYYVDEDFNVISQFTSDIAKRITTISIDQFVKRKTIENVTLIKFDIEGGEQMALKGAINTIKSQKPLLYIPIYHLNDDIYKIPEFLDMLGMPMKFALKWTEKLVWGMDCVLFVRFE